MIDIIDQIATAYNTLNFKLFEPLLMEDFIYESQMVLTPIKSRKAFLNYIEAKFNTIKQSDSKVFAEVGSIEKAGDGLLPCLIMAQNTINHKVGLLIITIKNKKVARLDMCIIPHWSKAYGSAQYPGLSEEYLPKPRMSYSIIANDKNYLSSCIAACAEYESYKLNPPDATKVVDWRLKYADIDDYLSSEDVLLTNPICLQFKRYYNDSGNFLSKLIHGE